MLADDDKKQSGSGDRAMAIPTKPNPRITQEGRLNRRPLKKMLPFSLKGLK
jgi:hypothetical protein